MRELRVSIPFVGGITAIYTPEEVQAKAAKLKELAAKTAVLVKDASKQLKVKAVATAKKTTAALDQYVQSIN